MKSRASLVLQQNSTAQPPWLHPEHHQTHRDGGGQPGNRQGRDKGPSRGHPSHSLHRWFTGRIFVGQPTLKQRAEWISPKAMAAVRLHREHHSLKKLTLVISAGLFETKAARSWNPDLRQWGWWCVGCCNDLLFYHPVNVVQVHLIGLVLFTVENVTDSVIICRCPLWLFMPSSSPADILIFIWKKKILHLLFFSNIKECLIDKY